MPNNKLKDNEIKKVLECCIGDTEGKNCFDCPLYEIDDCQAHMYLNSPDLINRLQSQNKDLAETIHNLTIEKDALFDRAEELKAEVEILKEFIVETRRCDKEIKSEAVKEFCEKRGIKYVEDDV